MQFNLQGNLSLCQDEIQKLAAIGFDDHWDDHQSMNDPLPTSGHAKRTVNVQLDSGDSGPLDHGRQVSTRVTFSKGENLDGVTVSYGQTDLVEALNRGLAVLGFALRDPGLALHYDTTSGITAIAPVKIRKAWREPLSQQD